MAKWVCQICGYVHEGDTPPEACPVCKAPAEKFTEQKEGEMEWAAEHVVGVAKGVPQDILDAFQDKFRLDYVTIVKNVYGGPAPARFLGSFAPFILSCYADSEYVRNLVDGNFCALFERTLSQYDRDLPVGVAGGFGYACKDILLRLGAQYGVRFTRFMASPIEGLIAYHAL